MAAATTRAQRCFPRIFSTASFIHPPRPSLSSPSANPAPAEPNTNLFVSGLSKRTTTEKLREAFSHFGDVLHARVVTDRVTGYSKGFGFVKYVTLEDATKGIEGMHGKAKTSSFSSPDQWFSFVSSVLNFCFPIIGPASKYTQGIGYAIGLLVVALYHLISAMWC